MAACLKTAMECFPSWKGRFPTLMGRCPECLNGPFSLLKIPGKLPIKKRPIKRFLDCCQKGHRPKKIFRELCCSKLPLPFPEKRVFVWSICLKVTVSGSKIWIARITQIIVLQICCFRFQKNLCRNYFQQTTIIVPLKIILNFNR